MTPETRRASIAALRREVDAVNGTAAVLWHPHTLAPDYGWRDGYEDLLPSLSPEGCKR